ncbi:hypothetical protein DM860_002033 [Cuscuta australis]|uniref:4a-hydroxytetrahydrobiopterin dehydratase n=1 Tax=Cuscuta australis TaxID=267555 RepID=A0A328DVN6_9ASTE|nr:hypothetical protein DM860_002033 [Cuscuta australis]
MLPTLRSRLLSSFVNVQVPLKAFSQSFHKNHGRSSFSLAGILQGHVGVTSNRNVYKGIRTFCTTEDLSIKKCVPCEAKDLRPMTEGAANVLMKQVPQWNLVNDGGTLKLHRSWKVKTFVKGMAFLELVADLAETEGHHPDLHLVGWNNVRIDIWTHGVGGLTENDFILAAKIDKLNVLDMLRREVPKPAGPHS